MPVLLVAQARLGPAPGDVRSAVEGFVVAAAAAAQTLRLIALQDAVPALPVVVVRHVLLGVRAVPPELVDRAVARCEDIERLGVVLVVLRLPGHVVEVAVPGREVEGGDGAELAAGVDKLADDVALSVSPGTANHGVVRILGREQPS